MINNNLVFYREIAKKNGFWLWTILLFLGVFYLNLVWKALGNIDDLITNILFYGAVLGLIWRRRDRINLNSNFFASFLGLSLLVVIVIKTLSLFSFESNLLSLVPFCAGLGVALIASGLRGLRQYGQELFFAWFLFFPTGLIGNFIDNIVKITVLNAKFATYCLYYLGFNVINRGNEVILSLPSLGNYKAIVDYSCAGMPMILLMLKLSLLLVSFFPVAKSQCFSIPMVSIVIGFVLGVVRVCILTLAIPEQATFDYWHGTEGSQIFSTAAIMIFAAFAYWMLNRDGLLDSSHAT
ncbi:Transmembrane exosortase [Xenococcus sp. PCC 7305]|uniref:cyanoexosortase A n=1 Tax=Xenococcus sp. PCC 7305 TaxID=102125 RepID=UPI0002ABC675|nr:cyanoexosortase A [Xenococcus sp. PCC 7305]ELS01847.1 Transmembrane exosortase [Xenococcus sp. PCC 7305]